MNMSARKIFSGVALASPLLLAFTSPAVAANAAVAIIQGSGTISPGLGATPAFQSISFTGTATVVGTDGAPATYGCSFSGTDPQGSAAAGAGTVSGSCGPLVFASCTFVREGAHVDVVCTAGGGGTGGAQAKCVFQPHQALPTTSYDLKCQAFVAIA